MIKDKIKRINIEFINKEFCFRNLKGKNNIFKRELLTIDDFGFSGLIYLHRNCHCIQKIFYSKGKNAYRLYAPNGFKELIKNQIELVKINDEINEILSSLEKNIYIYPEIKKRRL